MGFILCLLSTFNWNETYNINLKYNFLLQVFYYHHNKAVLLKKKNKKAYKQTLFSRTEKLEINQVSAIMLSYVTPI